MLQKSCGMNKCLSLVHLTSRYGAMVRINIRVGQQFLELLN